MPSSDFIHVLNSDLILVPEFSLPRCPLRFLQKWGNEACRQWLVIRKVWWMQQASCAAQAYLLTGLASLDAFQSKPPPGNLAAWGI